MSLEYVIYADESDADGKHFSDFYGGVLVRSRDLEPAQTTIRAAKVRNNLLGEVKWSKVTEPYLTKYIDLISTFFDMVAEDKIKVRIMFRQSAHVAVGLERRQIDERYTLLYYQFIKHAFGLTYSEEGPASVRLYLDMMPCGREEFSRFSSYVVALSEEPNFRRARITINSDQIAQVRSHDHDLMQCLDVVLGAMQFRLNDKHKQKIEGTNRRGKRTIAKEKLYKFILGRVRKIYHNFNIGISTGTPGGLQCRWNHPYRHWRFIPKSNVVDQTRFKDRR